jgi:hypothetical protein
VPVVLVFPKFDLIDPNEYETARNTAYTHCRALFGDVPAEVVSSNYSFVFFARKLSLMPSLFSARPRFHNFIERLVTTTNEVIIAYSPNISASPESQRTQPQIPPVRLAWGVSQRASRDIKIQATIECATLSLLLNLFSHTLRQGRAKQ